MQHTHLITGASGTIGRRLVRHVLEDTDHEMVLMVHTHGTGESALQFLRARLDLVDAETYARRVRLVQGDVAKADLGLDAATYAELTASVTHVIHAAATTQFNLPIVDARRVNVEGTRRVIRFFEACVQPIHLAFLSTAYVAGTQTGRIAEVPLDGAHGFANTYERSKFEAEALVTQMSGAASIYRLSTIIGDSTNGHVDHFTAPHQALRIMHLGLAAMVPGDPEYVVDLIPSDHASRALADLMLDERTYGRTYHITAGRGRSFMLRELLSESYDLLAHADPDWARKCYPRTPIVPQLTFDLFLRAATDAGNTLVSNVLGAMQHFAHQLNYPKEFDRTNTDAALPYFHERMPHIRTYYADVVNYCVSTKFGRL